MKKLVSALFLAVFISAMVAQAVQAQKKSVKCITCKHTGEVTLIVKVWKAKKHPSTCNTVPMFPMMDVSTYEANGNPNWYVEDYLSDFQWWVNENNLCPGIYNPQ